MPTGGCHKNARQWNPYESLHLLALVEQHGSKWREIGQWLGRTPASVRARYSRIETTQGQIRMKATDTRSNACDLCGLPRRGHVCVQNLACVFPASPCRQGGQASPATLDKGQSPNEGSSAEFVDWLLEDADIL